MTGALSGSTAACRRRTPRARGFDDLLQQGAADASAVQRVDDGDRDFRAFAAGLRAGEAGDRDAFGGAAGAGGAGAERVVVPAVERRQAVQLGFGQLAAGRVKAPPDRLR